MHEPGTVKMPVRGVKNLQYSMLANTNSRLTI